MKRDFESIDDFDEIGGALPQNLPNATAVLVLGILSIVTFWIYGVIGIILSIIALALHKSDKRIYDQNKTAYQQAFDTSNAGKICAIIGLVLSGLMFLLILLVLIVLASEGRF